MSQSNWIQFISVGLLSFITGYYCHKSIINNDKTDDSTKVKSAKSISPSIASENSSEASYEYVEEEELESDEESEDEGIDIDSTPLNAIPGEVRMTLIIRQDLKMTKGKAAAQCLHATLALYKKMTNSTLESYNPEMVERWEYENGQAKITLQVPNQEEMDTLFAQALSLGINSYIVHDAGRTQIAAGSATVLGLGPAPKLVIDQITKDLKLY